MNNKPSKSFKAGAISATIWDNKTEKGTFQTISLTRNYKDEQGNWKNTNTLRVNDLPKANLLLQKAFEACIVSEV